MEHQWIETANALLKYLSLFDDDALFRGQCEHYADTSGMTSIVPSQVRKQQVPQLRRKWIYYAMDALQMMASSEQLLHDPDVVEAMLQHYGWRSFFVDVTSSSAVASWFASHRFSQKVVIGTSEDWQENTVFLHHDWATYEPHCGTGHLYVLSKARLADLGLGTVDLNGRVQSTFPTRFSLQKAWLLGPTANIIPEDAVLAHVESPAEIFREFARSAGLTSTEVMFPKREEDVFLRVLLSVPWQHTDSYLGADTYARGLVLPEYDFKFDKFRDPAEAFYRVFWVAEHRLDDDILKQTAFYRVPEAVLYERAGEYGTHLPRLAALVRKFGSVCVEAEGIVRLAEHTDRHEYMKGVIARHIRNDIIEVSALILDHPGSTVSGAGINKGWMYRVDDSGTWLKTQHPGQCPCRNIVRHEQHFWILSGFDRLLEASSFSEGADLTFTFSAR